MKKRSAAVLICCVISFAVAAWSHFATAGIKVPPQCWPMAPGLNRATSFEPGEGFALGYISNAGGTPAGCGGVAFPCWGHTSAVDASLITPTISNANPFLGMQHLRLTYDPSTRTNRPGFGLGVDARFPRTQDLAGRPAAPNTVSVEIAISNPGGMNYRIQTQSFTQGSLATSALFMYDGSIHLLDDQCGTTALQFINTGAFWDTSGAYQNYTVAMNPCSDVINYAYGGALIYSSCLIAGTKREQLLIYGDNYPGSNLDVDNVVLSSLDECPCSCGNGIVEDGCGEQCEPGNYLTGCNPGHTCGFGQCRCNRVCTRNEPCVLNNGDNGPFYGPFDASMNGYFIYQALAGVEAVSVETCGTTGIDSRILYFGSCSDAADPGSANDDCCDPNESACGAFGQGSDPSASCFSNTGAPNTESCTCHNNPQPGDNCYLLIVDNSERCEDDLDSRWMITVNKKAACGQGHLGACCDTNGADVGCTDNVLAGACIGADKVWTENGKCAATNCVCIPDCAGRQCGDDGCGGSCGTCNDGRACDGVETCNANQTCDAGTPINCDDGIACTTDACREPNGICTHTTNNGACSDGNVCNGIESCNASLGCVPGLTLFCDDGLFCNGEEACAPATGCVPGVPPCAENETCNEARDQCLPSAIPTVSQWGLIVLTIVLLVAAKVRFRRQSDCRSR